MALMLVSALLDDDGEPLPEPEMPFKIPDGTPYTLLSAPQSRQAFQIKIVKVPRKVWDAAKVNGVGPLSNVEPDPIDAQIAARITAGACEMLKGPLVATRFTATDSPSEASADKPDGTKKTSSDGVKIAGFRDSEHSEVAT